jgi:two-component system chemotaxis response regulator CheB
MPRSALRTAGAEHVVRSADLPTLLLSLCSEEVDPAPRRSDDGDGDPPLDLLALEARIAALDADALHGSDRPGTPAGLGCPDCNGTLFEVDEDTSMVRYRCRVGHAWSPESLLTQQGLEVESALWIALRTLEDKAALNRRMAQDSEARGRTLTAKRFAQAAEESGYAAESVRRLLEQGDNPALGAAG